MAKRFLIICSLILLGVGVVTGASNTQFWTQLSGDHALSSDARLYVKPAWRYTDDGLFYSHFEGGISWAPFAWLGITPHYRQIFVGKDADWTVEYRPGLDLNLERKFHIGTIDFRNRNEYRIKPADESVRLRYRFRFTTPGFLPGGGQLRISDELFYDATDSEVDYTRFLLEGRFPFSQQTRISFVLGKQFYPSSQSGTDFTIIQTNIDYKF